MEMEAEKPTFNAFERFLYWFFIPIVFTMVLIGALLSLFDYNIMNQVLKVGDKVPGLSAILPDPKVDAKDADAKTSSAVNSPDKQAATDEAAVNDLKKQLEDKSAALQTAETSAQEKDQTIKDLQAKIATMETESKQQAKSDEEYQSLISQTADMYAKMSPSKSAPIMENLTLKEQVLILSAMKTDDRVRILEKMDSKKAAEASIYLKDATPAKDMQIAALQERLKINEKEAASGSSAALTKEDLGKTFAGMTPKSAAALLIEMDKTTPAKVTEILNSMDVSSRSKIMSSIADTSKEAAASITARLAP